MNRSININYYDGYIEIIKPDNTKIRLNQEEITMNDVADDRPLETTSVTATTISNIYDVTNENYIANFSYEGIYFRFIFGPAGAGIMADDCGTYMAMSSAVSPYHTSHYIDYEVISDNNNFPSIPSIDLKSWYLCAVKDYTTSEKTNWQYSYSYNIETNSRTGTAVSANNMVTKTTSNITSYLEEVYERNNNEDVLKKSTLHEFKERHKERPTNITTKTYNSNGNYITKENSYTYNDYGKVLTETLTVENNVKLEHTYMYSNNVYKSLLNHTLKKGNVIYTSTDYVVNDLGDITTQFIYNGNNEIQSKTAFTYDSNNNPLQTSWYKDNTNEIIKKEQYVYGTDGYLSRVYTTDSEGNIIANESYTYDNMGRVIETKDINKTEQVEYDSQGRVVKEKHKDGSYTTIEYDHANSIISVTDENGYYCEYQYNQMGLPYKLTDENDGEYTDLQTFTYDTMGNVISVKDALNNTTNITYDFLGRQTSVKYPGNTQTVKAKYYDVFLEGDTKYSVYLTISETGRISCEYYDVYGRLVKTALIKNYSSFSESDFDDIYQMPSNAQLIITSRYVYDDLDRVIEQYDGENRPTYYTYDSMGNVLNMTQGNVNESGNDPQIIVNYEYDSVGNITKSTQGTHVYTYEYDYAGRLTKLTDPMNFTETYTYDTAGNIKTSKDKNGDITTNTYNSRGLVSKTEKDNKYIEYTYDSVGNLLTSTDENGTISYTYNYDGTIASKTYPDNKTITYSGYNANKKLTSMTDYLGNTTTYAYNARGLIVSIGEKYSGTTSTNTTRYTYNSDGSLQKVTYPLSNYMTSTYTYDYAGRVSNLTNKLTSSSTYSTHAYTYDNSGNVTQKVDTINGTAKTTSYFYDSLNRLITENIGGSWNRYYYDQYNNLSSETGWGDTYYTYDANNRLISIDDQWCSKETEDGLLLADWESELTYDNNGNLLSYNTSSYGEVVKDSNQKSYTYNEWGQLTNFSDSLGESASYTYYSDGLRKSKTIGTNTTTYYYNGDNIINETLNGNSYATNVMGVNGYISRKQNGTVGYLFKDSHGDVLAAYSSTSNRIADYTYDAWGNIRNQGTQSWGADNPLRYYGQYYDTESGMTYLRARYYDSSIRRFITEDPIKDGLNWYAYAGNNPIMFFDPSGLAPEASDELEFCRLLMDLIQMKVDYANTGDISVTAGAESIKEKIMDLDIVKNNNGLNQLISEIIYGQDGSSLQEVSSLFNVIRYFGIKREYATSFLIPNEIEGVTYDELKKVFNDAVKEIDANSIYYVSDPLDINETQANKLLNTWLGNNKRLITPNTFRGNGRIAINVDIR